jgi:glycosyltransferase involved in cell wall biosynthesis
MHAKISVLVSDIDGPLEIISNGKYGFILKTGESNNCANKIYEISNDIKLIKMKNKIMKGMNFKQGKF